jgi:hypothetical protein
MACDLCKKMTNDELLTLADTICRYLPFKYHKAKICWDCNRVITKELDKWRDIAWQKAALKLVDLMEGK